jgi:hypothetical protein
MLQRWVDKNNKARLYLHGPCYMDGLVSTGTTFLTQY